MKLNLGDEEKKGGRDLEENVESQMRPDRAGRTKSKAEYMA